MKTTLKYTLAAAAVAVLAACGGGGGGEAPYNYSQHDGSYSCKQGDRPASTVSLRFTEKSLTLTGLVGDTSVTQIYDEKIGFINNKPYYSDFISQDNNQLSFTFYFQNDQLVVAAGPIADVPDKIKDAIGYSTCTKV